MLCEHPRDVDLVFKMQHNGITLAAVPSDDVIHRVDIVDAAVKENGQPIGHWHVAFHAEIHIQAIKMLKEAVRKQAQFIEATAVK